MKYTVKEIMSQLTKKENYDKVYVLPEGFLLIHTPSGAIPKSVHEGRACDVTGIYREWMVGIDNKENTARKMKEAATKFYK